jgi:cell division protein FtsB
MFAGALVAVARWYAWLVARTTLYTRFVLGISAAICLALLVFGADEAWLAHRIADHIRQVESQNARLRQDTTATLAQAQWAESDAAVEGAARAMGYALPGEQVVVIVTPRPGAAAQPTPAPAPPPAGSLAGDLASGSGQVRDSLNPFTIIFGG